LELHKQKGTILNAEDKFGTARDIAAVPENLTQLGELAIKMLNDKNLEVSRVRPFFWSLVETYVDRFQLYPFDVKKVLFSYLELNDYPEDTMRELVRQLELQYEKSHGRPMRKTTKPYFSQDARSEELDGLRDSLKYAAMVADKGE